MTPSAAPSTSEESHAEARPDVTDVQAAADEANHQELSVGDWVAAYYTVDRKWYPGKIKQVENSTGILVNCMADAQIKGKARYKWPQKEDTMWVEEMNVQKL